MHNASVSVCVIDIASGEVVAAHNADSNLTPASVTKTITSATALKHFSPDYVFRTRVECIGERTDDGVLDGDIVVVGGIDPTLGSKYFPDQPPFIDLVVDNLKAEGIKKINGVRLVNKYAICGSGLRCSVKKSLEDSVDTGLVFLC